MSFFGSFFGCSSVTSVGSYCERSDIEAIYGKANVKRWADLDNEQVLADIEDRITVSRDEAYIEINSLLATSRYDTPFEAPYTREITTLAAMYAGLWLYESRGSVDVDDNGRTVHRYAQQRKDFYRRVQGIIRGTRKVGNQEIVSPNTAPAVVNT